MQARNLKGMFADIERERTCECGRRFTQKLLSEKFLKLVEFRGERCYQNFVRQVPGGYVPVHCPSCESKDLGRQASIDQARYPQEPRPIFGEAAD